MQASKQFFGELLTQEQAIDIFLKADSNNDGEISFNEFVLASMDHEDLHNEKKLKAAFQMFDRNNDGTIQPEEIVAIFKSSEIFNLEMAKKMIAELDTDKDGKISYFEFEKFMKEEDIFLVLNDEKVTNTEEPEVN